MSEICLFFEYKKDNLYLSPLDKGQIMDMPPILTLALKKKTCDINFTDNIFKFSPVKQISICIITQTTIPARGSSTKINLQ